MYRVGGSSSTPSRSSRSYSSAPPASRLTQDDIEAISSHVMSSIMPKLADTITDTIMPKLIDMITDQISRAFKSTQVRNSIYQFVLIVNHISEILII